jgi:hydroxymethylbilane synthase
MTSSQAWLKLGTRGSALALIQAEDVRQRLAAAHRRPADDIALVIVRTSGDLIQDRALSEAGGKGLFTKELDAALLEGRIDFAVHSAKDLPTKLPDAIVIGGYLPREDARDAFIGHRARHLSELPRGVSFGSATLRRQAQVRRLRPDLDVVLLRGNVETRLGRVERGEIAGTLLALAGLKRLGLDQRVTAVLDMTDFLPAVGQGAIAVTQRAGDDATQTALAPIYDRDAGIALAAERAFLGVLDGSCRTPIAGHAILVEGEVRLRGQVLRPDGSQAHDVSLTGQQADAQRLGAAAGHDILGRLPAGFLEF